MLQMSEIGQIVSHGVLNPPQGIIDIGKNLQQGIIQLNQVSPLLLANHRVVKVGHQLETVVPMPTVPTQIILLPRTSPRVTLVLKDALAREIDAKILATELNTLIIDRSFPIMIDPIPSNQDLPPTPGHIMYLGQASSPDPRVGTDNNNEEIHVTHRVLITLPPHMTDLGQLQLAGRKQTETILEAMMMSPPETKVALHTIKTGMEKSITSSSKEINLLI